MDTTYRHELKYFVDLHEYEVLKSVLKRLLKQDANCRDSGDYWVRSLYFDTMNNSSYYDKVNGLASRKKIRLRTYGTSDEPIKFEIKHKENEFIRKESIIITREEAKKVLKKDYSFLTDRDDPMPIRLFYLLKKDYYRPAVLVDYIREAYCYEYGNIRITFDKKIQSSLSASSFFRDDIPMINVFNENIIVMEVKYYGSLPSVIRDILRGRKVARSAIGKYVLGRNLG